ncbi:hypothetical protein, unlikely [Trypanosoma brucei brucei TREU927]|uniref:Uncharacterized protein n=2 Tax=Trypanosoma brucei TaxID=5691 RepID=Q38FC3_TRYB2|nr:hypothetical protein, unlikely [Trypanosoma brucei brucei TREU927]EAN76497.1 hypothetical protein, unlikely [Trypanosoma brucei brucei TREU927]RHW69973.1 hypothetical protein DPX39_090016800 [Trypanosoma brucei equiperdum]
MIVVIMFFFDIDILHSGVLTERFPNLLFPLFTITYISHTRAFHSTSPFPPLRKK